MAGEKELGNDGNAIANPAVVALSMKKECVLHLVSVIVPTYNRAPLLSVTLETVRAQVYRPMETIVVDDGSTDNTASVVRHFKESTVGDIEVVYLRQTNQGAAAARNRGLEECRGEFIQYLDSDDLLHPEKISSQVAVLLQEPEVDYVFCAYGLVDEGEERSAAWPPSAFPVGRELIIDFMLGHNRRLRWPLNSNNGLYRRSLCVNVGPWDVEQRYMEDPLYNTRVLLTCNQCRYVPFVHVWVRRSGHGHAAAAVGQASAIADIRRGWQKLVRLLDDAGCLNRRRRCLIGRAYYGHARDAFMAGASAMGMELLDEGTHIAGVSCTWLNLRLARMLYSLLGTRTANVLFRAVRAIVPNALLVKGVR